MALFVDRRLQPSLGLSMAGVFALQTVSLVSLVAWTGLRYGQQAPRAAGAGFAQAPTDSHLTAVLGLLGLTLALLLGFLMFSLLDWRSRQSALEIQVRDRTQELQRALEFEALLKRITDKVRDSLDEAQILQTAVQELALGLQVNCCDTGLYNLEQQSSTISYESIVSDVQPAQGLLVPMTLFPEVYATLFQGKAIQFCRTLMTDTDPHIHLERDQHLVSLAVPLIDDRGVMGDLWLHRNPSQSFDESEIRLVQQVANQCAIALRQSRLYEESQAQVKELARLNHLKDDFLSTVSHELRTPMANIKMATQMLEISLRRQDSPQLDSQTARYLQVLEEECKRETELINDLLDLSRLEAGSEPLTLMPIDLKIWLPYLAEPFASRFQTQQQHFQLELAPDLPVLFSESHSLERVFAELLNNACKYTPPGETIAVTGTATPASFLLTLCNSGVEIPSTELPRIFDQFYRIPQHDPWRHGGTGLGLTLVRKLVERLGGTIRAESGNNSVTFIIQLPIGTEANSALNQE